MEISRVMHLPESYTIPSANASCGRPPTPVWSCSRAKGFISVELPGSEGDPKVHFVWSPRSPGVRELQQNLKWDPLVDVILGGGIHVHQPLWSWSSINIFSCFGKEKAKRGQSTILPRGPLPEAPLPPSTKTSPNTSPPSHLFSAIDISCRPKSGTRQTQYP